MLQGEFRTHYDGLQNVYYYFDTQYNLFIKFSDNCIYFARTMRGEVSIKNLKHNIEREGCEEFIDILKEKITSYGIDLDATFGIPCVAGDVDVNEGERVFLTSYTDMYDPNRITYQNYSIPFNFNIEALAKLADALPIDEGEYLIVERVAGTLATHLRY